MSFSPERAVLQAGNQASQLVLEQFRQGGEDPYQMERQLDGLTSVWAAEGYGALADNIANRTQLPDIAAVMETGEAVKISQRTGETVYEDADSIFSPAVRPAHYRVLIGAEQRDVEVPTVCLPEKKPRMKGTMNTEVLYDIGKLSPDTLSEDMQWLVGKLGNTPRYHGNSTGTESYIVDDASSQLMAVGLKVAQNALQRQQEQAWDEAHFVEQAAQETAARIQPRRLGLFALKGQALADEQAKVYRDTIHKMTRR